MMKDYKVIFKIKNNYMLTVMKLSDIHTAAELSRGCGVCQQIVGSYLNLKATPFQVSGKFKISIIKISEFLRVLPENLFPPQHLHKSLKTNTAEIEMDLMDVETLLTYDDPQRYLDIKERNEQIMITLATLTPREEKIIKYRMGFNGNKKSLEQCGEEFGVNKERIRQIEAKALRKLRHPTRSNKLKKWNES